MYTAAKKVSITIRVENNVRRRKQALTVANQ